MNNQSSISNSNIKNLSSLRGTAFRFVYLATGVALLIASIFAGSLWQLIQKQLLLQGVFLPLWRSLSCWRQETDSIPRPDRQIIWGCVR